MRFDDGEFATETKIRRLSNSAPASYTIYKEDSTIYAEACGPGLSDFSDKDASTVIQSAIGALTSGGKIFIKNGVYTIKTKLTSNNPYGIILEGEQGSATGIATELRGS